MTGIGRTVEWRSRGRWLSFGLAAVLILTALPLVFHRETGAMAGWNIGEDRFEVARAAIRAMREPTTEMLREAGMVVAGNTEAHAAVWETMIDAASPQEGEL